MRTRSFVILPSLFSIIMDFLFFFFSSLFFVYRVYLQCGYETKALSAHNPIFNTSYHHYHHYAVSTNNSSICTGFFFKIWDQLFNTKDDILKCKCYTCRPTSDRSMNVWKKTIQPDYSVLLNATWWLHAKLDVSEWTRLFVQFIVGSWSSGCEKKYLVAYSTFLDGCQDALF